MSLRQVVFTDVNGDDWDWEYTGSPYTWVRKRKDQTHIPFSEFMLRFSNDAHSKDAWVKTRYESVDGH